MKVVFAGPSIFGVDVDITGIDLRGPAQQGDLTRAVLDGATAIGLVDGVFSSVAAVWHKEILFALNRGTRVYGSSSMGALRAAECAIFGMVPIGKVALAYLSGEIDDDAAVALTIGPAEWGWQPFTEPLVDAVATLNHLRSLGEIAGEQYARLVAAATELHFAVRTRETMIASAIDGDEGNRVQEAYGRHHVSQKQLDALELIELIRGNEPRPSDLRWEFESSPMWRSFQPTDG